MMSSFSARLSKLMINQSPRYSEEHLLSITRMLVHLSILLVQNKVTFCKQTRERLLKFKLDLDLNLVNIMDLYMPCKETLHIPSSSFQLVIGLPKFGVRSLRHPLCRLDITAHISQADAGLQQDAVSSS